MSVAAATSTASRPFAFMTPRGSDAVEAGAGTRTPTVTDAGAVPQSVAPHQTEPDTTGGTDPLVNRFPTIAFSYDTDASRLVMLYRDPANGKTVSQIPTEAALKQYKEAQQKEKDAERASMLKLTVDGSGQGGGQAGGQSAAYGRAGTGGSLGAGAASSAAAGRWTAAASGGGGGAAVSTGASAGSSSVAHSSLVAAASAGTAAARVNVVI